MGLIQSAKLLFDGINDAVKEAEVAVVQTKTAGKFPDSFDRVQIRAIWRQEIQTELSLLMLLP